MLINGQYSWVRYAELRSMRAMPIDRHIETPRSASSP